METNRLVSLSLLKILLPLVTMGLPRINRLKKKKTFDEVFKEGRGFKEEFLFLKLKKNNLKMTRFGFIVGRRISKKAVIRNKIKRKLRELVRLKLKEIKKGFDVILIAIPGIEAKNFWEIEKTLAKLFKKAKLI